MRDNGINNLITDRTQSDVSLAAQLAGKGWAGMTASERAQWLAGLKGAYNAKDLNRVERAVQEINDYLNGMQGAIDAELAAEGVAPDQYWTVPFDPLSLNTKTDWAMQDIPTPSELERYLGNVDRLTEQFPVAKDLPASMEKLGFEGANEIERALLAEYEAGATYEAGQKALIQNTAKGYVQSGELYGGEWN